MHTRTAATGPRSHRGFIAFVTVVCLVAAALGYRWWFSDERAIHNRMDAIGEALTIPPNEGALGPVARAAALRKMLAPDIRLSAGPQEIVSRDAVLALATRWIAPAGGLIVEFDDVQTTIGEDRQHAEVYCTAKLTTRDPGTGQPTVDAREVTVGFVKLDGAWVVSSARTENTLAR